MEFSAGKRTIRSMKSKGRGLTEHRWTAMALAGSTRVGLQPGSQHTEHQTPGFINSPTEVAGQLYVPTMNVAANPRGLSLCCKETYQRNVSPVAQEAWVKAPSSPSHTTSPLLNRCAMNSDGGSTTWRLLLSDRQHVLTLWWCLRTGLFSRKSMG